MLNKAILMGRLTGNPELKTTQSGVSVTSFSLAVARPGKDQETDFISIVAWRRTAEFICRYFGKGDPIWLDGHIQARSYTAQDGSKRKVTEVVADRVGFCLNTTKSSDGSGSSGGIGTDIDEFEELGDGEDCPF